MGCGQRVLCCVSYRSEVWDTMHQGRWRASCETKGMQVNRRAQGTGLAVAAQLSPIMAAGSWF